MLTRKRVALSVRAGDDVVREELGVILAIRKLVLWAEGRRWQKERVRRIEEKQRKRQQESQGGLLRGLKSLPLASGQRVFGVMQHFRLVFGDRLLPVAAGLKDLGQNEVESR